MRTSILAAALAGLLSTARANIMDLKPGVAARATGADCTSAALSILASLPTPTGELFSALSSYVVTADIADPTALCAASQALPASLTSQFTVWEGQVSSWYSSESSQISAVVSSCTSDPIVQTVAFATSELQAYAASGCSGLVGAGSTTTSTSTTGGTATATVTKGTSTTGRSTGTAVSTAAATKPTGVLAGACAVAGFLGAVVIM